MARVFQMKLLLHAHTLDYEPGAAASNSTRTKDYLLKESQALTFSRFKFEHYLHVTCFGRRRTLAAQWEWETDCVFTVFGTQEQSLLKTVKALNTA